MPASGEHPEGQEHERGGARFITRVALKNYRSIKACDVELGALTFLVGPNGSGKSNFVDALRFTSEALGTTLELALSERDGIQEVRRRSGGHPTHFGIRFEFRLPTGVEGIYRFEVGAKAGGGFVVRVEECVVGSARFVVRSGSVDVMTEAVRPPASDDRLYLVTASGLPPFRDAFDSLRRMGFYNINPEQIRELKPADAGDLMRRDGSNVASVLDRMSKGVNGSRLAKERIERYLARVVPGIEGVDAHRMGKYETVQFRQRMASQPAPWQFLATNMSDGTLRALGNLVALFQTDRSAVVPVVAIEEPEAALHPAAVEVLLDALFDASSRTQVIVTSHSPDLLDSPQIDDRQILAVAASEGVSEIGPIDAVGREALHRRLYTAGELLRQDQLRPEADAARRAEQKQGSLFEPDGR